MIQAAPPAAEGQPIDELMAGLAREGSPGQPESATRVLARAPVAPPPAPPTLVVRTPTAAMPVAAMPVAAMKVVPTPTAPMVVAQIKEPELLLPPTTGGGFEVVAAEPAASNEGPASRRNLFVFGVSLVAGVVLAGLFVRMRSGDASGAAPSLASSIVASPSAELSPSAAAPPPASADVDPASSSTPPADEPPEMIELPATPASSASPPRTVRRQQTAPVPTKRDPKSWR